MFELASLFLTAAPPGSVGEVTVENWRRVNLRERFRVASPCDELLGRDKVDVRESKYRVQELQESFLAMGAVKEPSSVEEKREGSLRLGVVLKEVLGENLLDRVRVFVVETTVSHGTGASPDILESLHGDLPHPGVRVLWTGSHTAGMGHLVFQGVRPGGGTSGHGRVVVEAIPTQHIEHFVSAHSQEWSSHSLDICRIDSSKPDQ